MTDFSKKIDDFWIVKYRRLIYRLTLNDLKIKYNDKVIGFAWSLLNPLLTMLVLYFIFFSIRHREEFFAQYLIIGLVVWRFFALGSAASLKSMVTKFSIIENYPIPRQVFVLVIVLSAFISFFLEFIILIPLVSVFTGGFSIYAFLFPLIHVLYFILVYGVGLVLASIYPYFRDSSEIWGVVVQLGFFVSPIIYPLDIIPAQFLPYYLLNPITQVIIMYRQILLYGELPSLMSIGYVLAVGIIILVIGTAIFHRLQKRFVEVI